MYQFISFRSVAKQGADMESQDRASACRIKNATFSCGGASPGTCSRAAAEVLRFSHHSVGKACGKW